MTLLLDLSRGANILNISVIKALFLLPRKDLFMSIDYIIYGLLSLVPPVLIITLVLKTKDIKKSFFFGILSAMLILPITNGVTSIVDERLIVSFDGYTIGSYFEGLYLGVKTVFDSIFDIFFEDGGLFGFINGWNMSIIFFLFALGIMTSFMVMSGGTKALTEYLSKKIKTRKGTLLLTAFLGIVIFIDDYFNALVVGNVSKPLCEKHKISRAKLSYIVDSTAAPICVIAIVSSWGAGIVGNLGAAIEGNSALAGNNAIVAFFGAIPYQFYVITALASVFIMIFKDFNIGEMRKYEEEALVGNDSSKVEEELNLDKSVTDGKIFNILFPLLSLVVATIGAMLISGFVGCEGNVTFFGVLENIDVALSLRAGGIAALVSSFIPVIPLLKNKIIDKKKLGSTVKEGFGSMLQANVILLCAWLISTLIGLLGSKYFLAEVIIVSKFPVEFLPVIIFVFAAFMAFSTGTSWGTFGILIPIVTSIISSVAPDMFVPVVAATLSGAIFGDHASPISDTTLLSSAGSGCVHTKHFSTQLPYALMSAIIALLGYLVFGVFKLIFKANLIGLLAAYVIIIASYVVILIWYKRKYKLSK